MQKDFFTQLAKDMKYKTASKILRSIKTPGYVLQCCIHVLALFTNIMLRMCSRPFYFRKWQF